MWGFSFSFKDRIAIFDTTLRDGEQMPGVVFKPDEKIDLALKSSEFGSKAINLMPSISESEATVAKKLSGMGLESEIAADCMLRKDHVEKAIECGVDRIVPFTSVSDIHLEKKLGISREDNISRSLDIIDFVKSHGIKLDFAVEDATRSDMNYLIEFIDSVSPYIEYFLPADTVGNMNPFETHWFFTELMKKTETKFCIHSHNDFGMATANVLSALCAGVDSFSGTFNGIGERAGNSAIEEVCVALKHLFNYDMGVKYSILGEISSSVEKYSGVFLQKHKPIVGENAFSHESGIHVDGVLKHTRNYENFDPRDIGRKRKIVFGKHTGGSGIRYLIKKQKISGIKSEELLENLKRFSQENKVAFSEDSVADFVKYNAGGVGFDF